MKVYVFTTHQVNGFEDLGIHNSVFAKEQDAVKALKEFRDDEMQYIRRDGWTIETDESHYFEAFEPGRYIECHSLGFVTEEEVL